MVYCGTVSTKEEGENILAISYIKNMKTVLQTCIFLLKKSELFLAFAPNFVTKEQKQHPLGDLLFLRSSKNRFPYFYSEKILKQFIKKSKSLRTL